MSGLALSQAHGALRRHLGVVFDICHQAVEFEDVPESLASLTAAGIPVFKLQEAAALWVPDVNVDTVNELEIETYTRDVLPDHLKNADITTYVLGSWSGSWSSYARSRVI